MSVVAVKVNPTTIEIASDSILAYGWTQDKGSNTFSKLFQVNGLTIGTVGHASEITLMKIFCQTRKPKAANEDAILQFLAEFAEWQQDKTSDYGIKNAYIIVFKNKVFAADGFFVEEIITCEAIGAGGDFAKASLYLGKSATRSCYVASQLSVMCEPPIHTMSIQK